MLKHLLLVHGMRRGDLNKRLSSFIEDLMAPQELEFATAFLESDTQNPYVVIERLIDEGATRIVITPLLILSASHMKEDVAEIKEHFESSHPRIKIEVRPTLAHHPLTKEIVRQRVDDAVDSTVDATGVVIIAHGNARFPETDKELEAFTEELDTGYDTHPLMLYGNLSFEALVPEIARQYQHLIIVPLFLYDGYLVNKIKGKLEEMDLHATFCYTRSLDFDPLLNRVIKDHMTGEE